MPTRHGGRLAKRASTWPRDHFCRSTIAPRSSWPTTWNEFLPISMPITAIALSNFWDMASSLSLAPLPSILLLVGQEHGRTIPLPDLSCISQQACCTSIFIPADHSDNLVGAGRDRG